MFLTRRRFRHRDLTAGYCSSALSNGKESPDTFISTASANRSSVMPSASVNGPLRVELRASDVHRTDRVCAEIMSERANIGSFIRISIARVSRGGIHARISSDR